MSLKHILAVAAAVVGVTALTPQAHAITVAGSSSGTFSNISGCGGDNCRINSTSNGSSTQVEWGYSRFESGSTLTANDVNFNTNTDANDVTLAKLTWFNASTLASNTPDDFNVNYNLTVQFTSPSNSQDTEQFALTITNLGTDHITGLTMADLSNLSFTLAGVTVSDLHFVIQNGTSGTFANNLWTNPEDHTSGLLLVGDVKAVPEPGTLALLATGLVGFGGLTRRRRRS
jgi:hypothetical protein